MAVLQETVPCAVISSFSPSLSVWLVPSLWPGPQLLDLRAAQPRREVALAPVVEEAAVPRTVEAARVVVAPGGMEAVQAAADGTVAPAARMEAVTMEARMVAVGAMVRAVPHTPVALRRAEPPALTEVMVAATT